MTDYDAQIDSVLKNCAADNWNSYQAHAVTPEVGRNVRRFLRSIWITPTNEGGMSVAWAGEDLSIEFGPDGLIAAIYAEVKRVNEMLVLSESELRTKTGKVLTEADIEVLADEAEQGYDVTEEDDDRPCEDRGYFDFTTPSTEDADNA